ncbi:hypothetical protein [Vibrio sp. Evd11]|uniref:hypothetical protein n=1 Tax=Vibrio sp. Evd11 TaxID=1207404 RepID=UPI000EFB6805|nr:hypothetical protein [Vibrio sp. Evd11]
MRTLAIYSLLLMSTFLSTLSRANCVIGNGEILQAGESTAIVDVEQLNALAKSFYDEGKVESLEQGMVKARTYDGVYVPLKCSPMLTVNQELDISITGYALVPEWDGQF